MLHFECCSAPLAHAVGSLAPRGPKVLDYQNLGFCSKGMHRCRSRESMCSGWEGLNPRATLLSVWFQAKDSGCAPACLPPKWQNTFSQRAPWRINEIICIKELVQCLGRGGSWIYGDNNDYTCTVNLIYGQGLSFWGKVETGCSVPFLILM